MSGYQTVLMVERIKERADKLGFMLCYPKHGWGGRDSVDTVAIKPKDADSLPIYARDAQFFCGTIVQLASFFEGLEWARQYDEMLRLSNEKKRARKEQDIRNEKLVRMLQTGQDPDQTHEIVQT